MAAVKSFVDNQDRTPGVHYPVGIECRDSGALLLQKLKTNFGFDAFLPPQREAIEAMLSAKDVFLSLPTGAGKSLIYQLAAMRTYDENKKVTIVISPLNSLIGDQEKVLQRKGLGPQTRSINGLKSARENREAIDAVLDEEVALLYITPESMIGRLEQLSSPRLRSRIARIVVDEVHSVLTSDYRPKVGELAALLRENFEAIPIAACTATATPASRVSIIKTLQIQQCIIFKADLDRPNIRYQVIWRHSHLRETVPLLRQLLEKRQGSKGIIYCSKKKSCERIIELLGSDFKLDAYYAGLPEGDDRAKMRLANWINPNNTRVSALVATKALGLGIDHPSLRWVIHFDAPDSLEEYLQESGRAGRDGAPADAILLWRPRLVGGHSLKPTQIPEQDDLATSVDMNTYGYSPLCRRYVLLRYMGQPMEHSHECHNCDNCRRPMMNIVDFTSEAQQILSALNKLGFDKKQITVLDLATATTFSRDLTGVKSTLGNSFKTVDAAEYIIGYLILCRVLKVNVVVGVRRGRALGNSGDAQWYIQVGPKHAEFTQRGLKLKADLGSLHCKDFVF